MDKNSIIGFVLIALIMFGFFGYQSHEVRKQQAVQARLDSLRIAEEYAQWQKDSAYRAEHPEAVVAPAEDVADKQLPSYSDALLNEAAAAPAEYVTLENAKLKAVFTTRGGQPYSVCVKDYSTYSKDSLYLLAAGKSELGYIVYAPTAIDTRKFTFQYVPEASSESTVVMRLPLSS